MKILDKHISRQIWIPSLLALTAVCVIAVANEIQRYLSRLPISHVTLGDISKLSMFLIPTLAAFVIPVMYLMGIMLAFGRLSQNGEITAMKAAGIPLKRVIMPVIIAGAALSIACFLIQDRLQPWAIKHIYTLMSDVPKRITLNVLSPGVMHDFREWNVYIGSKDPDGNTLRDVDILKPDKGGGVEVYSAKSASITGEGDDMKLVLKDYHVITPDKNGGLAWATGDGAVLNLPPMIIKEPTETNSSLPLSSLIMKEREISAGMSEKSSLRTKNKLQSLRRDIAERTSFPFACLAVCLVAAPLGVRARRSGRSYTFSVGSAIIVIYYVLHMAVEPTSLHSLPTMFIRAWLPNIVLISTGIWFIWRVDRT